MKDLNEIEKEVIELAKSHIIDDSLDINSLKESVKTSFSDDEQEAAMGIVISLEGVMETKASRAVLDSGLSAAQLATDGAVGIVTYLDDFTARCGTLTDKLNDDIAFLKSNKEVN